MSSSPDVVDSNDFFDSIDYHFHFDVILYQFLFHMTYPLMLPLIVYKHGITSLYSQMFLPINSSVPFYV